MNYNAYVINKADVSYLDNILLDEEKNLKVVPYNDLKDIPQVHISQYCVENGFYCIPTEELIEFLKMEIGNKKAIEIGAGNGTICKALGIVGTDNFMQMIPKYKEYYEELQQSIVPYGDHVECLDAVEAVKKYKPDVVISAWCTHKYDPKRHELGGNEIGIDEEFILANVEKYIHIGNIGVYGLKHILSVPHRAVNESWLISRSMRNDYNVIWIWGD